ncbi:hypothetical protein [Novosphingobium sp. MD-1]|uniref:hypothetical protein n=1 Tax=Novosphingobium sp. MD-1 TaxID=1630648 RepID=UPI00061BA8F6|nr:hypothetical protein [Novosphingobium sp. MD-1]GAO52901.1 hypothetical protein NMD1_00868 [Novosphingobium sp. MD-1]
MSDTEFSAAEKLRAIQIAHEQMLVAVISTVCDLRPQDDTVRLTIARRFKDLVCRHQLTDVSSPVKAEAVTMFMLDAGQKLIGQVLPRPLSNQIPVPSPDK